MIPLMNPDRRESQGGEREQCMAHKMFCAIARQEACAVYPISKQFWSLHYC